MAGDKGDACSSTIFKWKEVSSKGQNAIAAIAKAKRGRVKVQHQRNTLLYYGSSHNPGNVLPLELVCNAMRLPSLVSGSSFENREKEIIPCSKCLWMKWPNLQVQHPITMYAILMSPMS